MQVLLEIGTHAGAVCLRQFWVWKRIMAASVSTNIAEPVIMLFAFGFGLGAVIDQMAGLAYLAFILPGMMAYSTMFSASFETSIGSFARFDFQKTWDAILATPVSLLELMAGEALWAAIKATVSACCVLLVGLLWGGIGSYAGALMSLPALFLGALCFAACGLCATAHSKSWEFFSYFFTFWVTPQFVFSGVFFEIDRFPDVIEALAWILPMTHLIQIVRPLTAAQPLELTAALGHLSYLLVLMVMAFTLAYRRFHRRLFD